MGQKKKRRIGRVRAKVHGSAERPRLAVFRSNKKMYAQLIDDATGRTLVAAGGEKTSGKKEAKTSEAGKVGTLVARRAKEAGITRAVFDRRSYQYHGRVKALVEAARKEGLTI